MKSTRTFIAIPLDAKPLAAVERLIGQLRPQLGSVRWVTGDNLHFTLVFLGDVPDEQIPEVCEAVNRGARGQPPLDLALHGIGAFPDRRRPRILWVGCREGSEPAVALHDAIEKELAPLGFRQEQRAFQPHLTIGRTQQHGRLSPVALQQIERLAGWEGGVTHVAEVHVMGSVLSRSGPTYTVLSRVALKSEI